MEARRFFWADDECCRPPSSVFRQAQSQTQMIRYTPLYYEGDQQ